ncbi:hypothetical protein K270103H11_28020 [Gordonibacter urolithinfaciens]
MCRVGGAPAPPPPSGARTQLGSERAPSFPPVAAMLNPVPLANENRVQHCGNLLLRPFPLEAPLSSVPVIAIRHRREGCLGVEERSGNGRKGAPEFLRQPCMPCAYRTAPGTSPPELP